MAQMALQPWLLRDTWPLSNAHYSHSLELAPQSVEDAASTREAAAHVSNRLSTPWLLGLLAQGGGSLGAARSPALPGGGGETSPTARLPPPPRLPSNAGQDTLEVVSRCLRASSVTHPSQLGLILPDLATVAHYLEQFRQQFHASGHVPRDRVTAPCIARVAPSQLVASLLQSHQRPAEQCAAALDLCARSGQASYAIELLWFMAHARLPLVPRHFAALIAALCAAGRHAEAERLYGEFVCSALVPPLWGSAGSDDDAMAAPLHGDGAEDGALYCSDCTTPAVTAVDLHPTWALLTGLACVGGRAAMARVLFSSVAAGRSSSPFSRGDTLPAATQIPGQKSQSHPWDLLHAVGAPWPVFAAWAGRMMLASGAGGDVEAACRHWTDLAQLAWREASQTPGAETRTPWTGAGGPASSASAYDPAGLGIAPTSERLAPFAAALESSLQTLLSVCAHTGNAVRARALFEAVASRDVAHARAVNAVAEEYTGRVQGSGGRDGPLLFSFLAEFESSRRGEDGGEGSAASAPPSEPSAVQSPPSLPSGATAAVVQAELRLSRLASSSLIAGALLRQVAGAPPTHEAEIRSLAVSRSAGQRAPESDSGAVPVSVQHLISQMRCALVVDVGDSAAGGGGGGGSLNAQETHRQRSPVPHSGAEVCVSSLLRSLQADGSAARLDSPPDSGSTPFPLHPRAQSMYAVLLALQDAGRKVSPPLFGTLTPAHYGAVVAAYARSGGLTDPNSPMGMRGPNSPVGTQDAAHVLRLLLQRAASGAGGPDPRGTSGAGGAAGGWHAAATAACAAVLGSLTAAALQPDPAPPAPHGVTAAQTITPDAAFAECEALLRFMAAHDDECASPSASTVQSVAAMLCYRATTAHKHLPPTAGASYTGYSSAAAPKPPSSHEVQEQEQQSTGELALLLEAVQSDAVLGCDAPCIARLVALLPLISQGPTHSPTPPRDPSRDSLFLLRRHFDLEEGGAPAPAAAVALGGDPTLLAPPPQQPLPQLQATPAVIAAGIRLAVAASDRAALRFLLRLMRRQAVSPTVGILLELVRGLDLGEGLDLGVEGLDPRVGAPQVREQGQRGQRAPPSPGMRHALVDACAEVVGWSLGGGAVSAVAAEQLQAVGLAPLLLLRLSRAASLCELTGEPFLGVVESLSARVAPLLELDFGRPDASASAVAAANALFSALAFAHRSAVGGAAGDCHRDRAAGAALAVSLFADMFPRGSDFCLYAPGDASAVAAAAAGDGAHPPGSAFSYRSSLQLEASIHRAVTVGQPCPTGGAKPDGNNAARARVLLLLLRSAAMAVECITTHASPGGGGVMDPRVILSALVRLVGAAQGAPPSGAPQSPLLVSALAQLRVAPPTAPFIPTVQHAADALLGPLHALLPSCSDPRDALRLAVETCAAMRTPPTATTLALFLDACVPRGIGSPSSSADAAVVVLLREAGVHFPAFSRLCTSAATATATASGGAGAALPPPCNDPPCTPSAYTDALMWSNWRVAALRMQALASPTGTAAAMEALWSEWCARNPATDRETRSALCAEYVAALAAVLERETASGARWGTWKAPSSAAMGHASPPLPPPALSASRRAVCDALFHSNGGDLDLDLGVFLSLVSTLSAGGLAAQSRSLVRLLLAHHRGVDMTSFSLEASLTRDAAAQAKAVLLGAAAAGPGPQQRVPPHTSMRGSFSGGHMAFVDGQVGEGKAPAAAAAAAHGRWVGAAEAVLARTVAAAATAGASVLSFSSRRQGEHRLLGADSLEVLRCGVSSDGALFGGVVVAAPRFRLPSANRWDGSPFAPLHSREESSSSTDGAVPPYPSVPHHPLSPQHALEAQFHALITAVGTSGCSPEEAHRLIEDTWALAATLHAPYPQQPPFRFDRCSGVCAYAALVATGAGVEAADALLQDHARFDWGACRCPRSAAPRPSAAQAVRSLNTLRIIGLCAGGRPLEALRLLEAHLVGVPGPGGRAGACPVHEAPVHPLAITAVLAAASCLPGRELTRYPCPDAPLTAYHASYASARAAVGLASGGGPTPAPSPGSYSSPSAPVLHRLERLARGVLAGGGDPLEDGGCGYGGPAKNELRKHAPSQSFSLSGGGVGAGEHPTGHYSADLADQAMDAIHALLLPPTTQPSHSPSAAAPRYDTLPSGAGAPPLAAGSHPAPPQGCWRPSAQDTAALVRLYAAAAAAGGSIDAALGVALAGLDLELGAGADTPTPRCGGEARLALDHLLLLAPMPSMGAPAPPSQSPASASGVVAEGRGAGTGGGVFWDPRGSGGSDSPLASGSPLADATSPHGSSSSSRGNPTVPAPLHETLRTWGLAPRAWGLAPRASDVAAPSHSMGRSSSAPDWSGGRRQNAHAAQHKSASAAATLIILESVLWVLVSAPTSQYITERGVSLVRATLSLVDALLPGSPGSTQHVTTAAAAGVAAAAPAEAHAAPSLTLHACAAMSAVVLSRLRVAGGVASLPGGIHAASLHVRDDADSAAAGGEDAPMIGGAISEGDASREPAAVAECLSAMPGGCPPLLLRALSSLSQEGVKCSPAAHWSLEQAGVGYVAVMHALGLLPAAPPVLRSSIDTRPALPAHLVASVAACVGFPGARGTGSVKAAPGSPSPADVAASDWARRALQCFHSERAAVQRPVALTRVEEWACMAHRAMGAVAPPSAWSPVEVDGPLCEDCFHSQTLRQQQLPQPLLLLEGETTGPPPSQWDRPSRQPRVPHTGEPLHGSGAPSAAWGYLTDADVLLPLGRGPPQLPHFAPVPDTSPFGLQAQSRPLLGNGPSRGNATRHAHQASESLAGRQLSDAEAEVAGLAMESEHLAALTKAAERELRQLGAGRTISSSALLEEDHDTPSSLPHPPPLSDATLAQHRHRLAAGLAALQAQSTALATSVGLLPSARRAFLAYSTAEQAALRDQAAALEAVFTADAGIEALELGAVHAARSLVQARAFEASIRARIQAAERSHDSGAAAAVSCDRLVLWEARGEVRRLTAQVLGPPAYALLSAQAVRQSRSHRDRAHASCAAAADATAAAGAAADELISDGRARLRTQGAVVASLAARLKRDEQGLLPSLAQQEEALRRGVAALRARLAALQQDAADAQSAALTTGGDGTASALERTRSLQSSATGSGLQALSAAASLAVLAQASVAHSSAEHAMQQQRRNAERLEGLLAPVRAEGAGALGAVRAYYGSTQASDAAQAALEADMVSSVIRGQVAQMVTRGVGQARDAHTIASARIAAARAQIAGLQREVYSLAEENLALGVALEEGTSAVACDSDGSARCVGAAAASTSSPLFGGSLAALATSLFSGDSPRLIGELDAWESMAEASVFRREREILLGGARCVTSGARAALLEGGDEGWGPTGATPVAAAAAVSEPARLVSSLQALYEEELERTRALPRPMTADALQKLLLLLRPGPEGEEEAAAALAAEAPTPQAQSTSTPKARSPSPVSRNRGQASPASPPHIRGAAGDAGKTWTLSSPASPAALMLAPAPLLGATAARRPAPSRGAASVAKQRSGALSPLLSSPKVGVASASPQGRVQGSKPGGRAVAVGLGSPPHVPPRLGLKSSFAVTLKSPT